MEANGTRVMRDLGNGETEQVYPQTTADNVLGLDDRIRQIVGEMTNGGQNNG